MSNEEKVMSGLQVVARSTGQEPPGDATVIPEIDSTRPVSKIAREVGMLLRKSPLFHTGLGFVTVDPATGDREEMAPERFCSWLERYLFFYRPGRSDEMRKLHTIRRDYAKLLLAADEFKRQIRELKAVHDVRLPVWRGSSEVALDGRGAFWLREGAEQQLELLEKGYDAKTGIFTVDRIPYDANLSFEAGRDFLIEHLRQFPFAEDGPVENRRSLGAHLAAMIGTFCRTLFPETSIRPMMIYNGNQPGSGKSLLMRMALTPVHGAPPEDSKPKSDDELRKILDTAAIYQKPFLVLDDVANLVSHDLNRFTTSPVHEPRILGQSRKVICPNVTQVFVTGNQLTITEDLARRGLNVDLFEAGKATDRRFGAREITSDWLSLPSTRAEFLAAMWAVVGHWQEAGMPYDPEARHNSATVWASVIGSIVRHSFKVNAFAPREFDMGGDEASAAMEGLIIDLASDLSGHGAEFTSSEILDAAEARGLLEVIAPWARDPRKVIGQRLRKLRGRQFKDKTGRKFEFGRRHNSKGAVYPIRFPDD